MPSIQRLAGKAAFAGLAPLSLAIALAVPGTAPATAPGANGRLVYESPVGPQPARIPGNHDLFTIGADGADRQRLLATPRYETEGAWSPDGSQVVFAQRDRPRGNYDLFIANADGGNLRRLVGGRSFEIAPSWSPDGSVIAFSSDRGQPIPKSERDPAPVLQIWTVRPDGSGLRQVTRPRRTREELVDASWAPDGRRLAVGFNRFGRRSFDLRLAIVEVGTGAVRGLTPRGGAQELNPNWSPDGGSLLLEVSDGGPFGSPPARSDIAQMSPDGGPMTRLTQTRVHETNPIWSPDGTRIAFTSDRDNRALSRERRGRGFELYTMAAGGGDVRRLTNNRTAELFPDWQPLRGG